MKVPIRLGAAVFPALLLAVGCGHEGGMSEPTAPPAAALDAAPMLVEFGPWSAPEPLTIVNSLPDPAKGITALMAVDNTPAISSDGLTLYFASTRPGGKGGTDLWVARRRSIDEPWETPANVVGETINTAAIEVGPSLSADGLLLFFSSSRPSSPDEEGRCGGVGTPHCDNDLWVSSRACTDHADASCAWGKPTNLGPMVNTPLFEGGQVVRGSEFYFNRGLTANRIAGAPDPGPPSDLYVSRINIDKFTPRGLEPGALTRAVPVEKLNTEAVEQRAALTSDGHEIFFTSSRADTPDIWTATRPGLGQSWGEPARVVSGANPQAINTDFQDLHPSISSDGTTLFFASNRAGSFDIYVSTRSRRLRE